jgi:hypothetical protein
MSPTLNALAMSEHIADLHRAAHGRGAARASWLRRRSPTTVGRRRRRTRPALRPRLA